MTEPMVALSEHIAAPMERVWACLTDRDAVRRWFGPHMRLDARPGGGFTEVWRDGVRTVATTGRVRHIKLDLVEQSTHLQLVHSGWLSLGPEAFALAEAHRAGWRIHLESLRRFVEEGLGARAN